MSENLDPKDASAPEVNADAAETVNETAQATTETGGDAQRIAGLEQQVAMLNDKYLRLYSEFDNYRRRTAKESLELRKTAAEEVIKKLLPILDDFERAIRNNATATDVAAINEGVQLIAGKFHHVLTQQGLEAMNAGGQAFDPEFHEAITEIPAPAPELKGKVVDEVEKGYLLAGKVIRYAKVVVGS
ncbi:MAG: nucleotide exchange factor GrpE [Bacteroidia bacterium]|jgi:molecular chaperone GrpE|nr:nucleotide exchange factor GrpE [Bacteroidia bacterium]